MLWIHHDQVVSSEGQNGPQHVGRRILGHLDRIEAVERIVVEGHLGSDAVPRVRSKWHATYLRAWLHGSPVLAMASGPEPGSQEVVDVWFTPEARSSWRHYVERDLSVVPPRRRTRVHETGDDASPYVILGVRIRRWNASQDLPKPLIGATRDDPDGIAFLNGLGRRRWKPIAHALVAEMVKDARRPVPEATSTSRYQIATIGDGQMIRYGIFGPVWIDADAAVHLAGLAGFPLGNPEDIPQPLGGEGWSRLSELLPEPGSEGCARLEGRMQRTESIGYEVLLAEVGQAELKRVFPEYRWGRGGRHGERLRDEKDAEYHRMLYRGQPAIGARVRDRQEVWLSSSAQVRLIEDHSGSDASEDVAPDESEAASESQDDVARPRKRHRRVIARVARALAALEDEGIALVLQEGVLKARVKDRKSGREGLVTVFPEAPVIPCIERS